MVDLAGPIAPDDVPPGYQMTELGPLPAEWRAVTVGEIATARGGSAFPLRYQGHVSGELPFYKVSDMTTAGNEATMHQANHYVDADSMAQLKAKPFPPGTVIFPKVGAAVHTNKKRLLSVRALVDNNVMGVTTRDGTCLPEFLYYWFLTQDLGDFSNPGPLPSINTRPILEARMPLPPLPEQRAIAHVLSTVQRAREASEAVVTAMRELKKSLMRHLFTYGAVPVDQIDQVRLKETEVGPVPQHWTVEPLGDLLREPLRNGHSAREARTGVRTLTLTAVTRNDFSITNTKLTSAEPAKVRDLWLEPSDVLVERANTKELVGLAALYEGDRGFAIFPDLMVRVRADESRIGSRFLAEFLLTPSCRRYFQRSARGTAGNMPKIDHGTIGGARLPVPPLSEQRAIERVVHSLSSKIHAEAARAKSLEALFDALLDALLTGGLRACSTARWDSPHGWNSVGPACPSTST